MSQVVTCPPTALGDTSDPVNLELSRLLCDDGQSANSRDGSGNTLESCGVNPPAAATPPRVGKVLRPPGSVDAMVVVMCIFFKKQDNGSAAVPGNVQ